ncbi:MAG: hypothetical protein AABX82_07985, partial [Nanoarchaeota archaeon]
VGREEITKVATIIGDGYPSVLSSQAEVLLKLYAPFLEEQTFEITHNGGVALPRSSFRGGQQIKSDLSEEHKRVYCATVEEKLREYAKLIARNKAANKSYQTPQFTEEKAVEIAQEAFEESFRKTKTSYR